MALTSMLAVHLALFAHGSPPLGVEYLGSTLFPVGFKVGTTVMSEISAIKFARKSDGSACDPGLEACKVLALSDTGNLFTATLDIRDGKLDEQSMAWMPEVTPLISKDSSGADRTRHDTEGLAVGQGSNSRLWVSLEGPSDIQVFDAATGAWRSSPFEVPEIVKDHENANKGFEALCSTPLGKKIITTTEHHLSVDSPRMHRFFQFNVAGGAPTRQAKYMADDQPSDPTKGFGVVELEALNDQALDGGSLLALERAYDPSIGNTIRLYRADAVDIEDASEKEIQTSMNKALLFEWNSSGLRSAIGDADGGVWNVPVPVDNYEGMTLVPSSSSNALKGRLLLLVNDDNQNENQIGTQFVLLRLLYGPQMMLL